MQIFKRRVLSSFMHELEEPLLRTKRIKIEKQEQLKLSLIGKHADFLARHKTNPNTLSYLGLLSACVAALFITLNFLHDFWLWWPPIFFFVLAGYFDLLDGEVARRTKTDSKRGAFLDSILDRVSDIIIIVALNYVGLIDHYSGYLFIFLIIMISYARTRAEALGIEMKGVGFMERAPRMLFLCCAMVIEFLSFYFFSYSTFWISMILFGVLLFHTLWQRVSFALKEL